MKKNKATPEEKQLLSEILGGDDLALSKLYTLHGETIITSLKSWYPKVAQKDEALVLEAVNEAFWGFFNNPATFDPERNSLKRFLEVAADRDLINILNREKKHSLKKDLPEDVELQEKLWNSTVGNGNSADSEMIHDELMETAENELARYFKTEQDISLVKLILQKERETGVYVEVLGIQNLSIDEQREEVKRHKDRIKKVLQRNQVEQKINKLIQ